MPDLIEIHSSNGDAPPGLDEIAREGARRMLAVALEAEAADYIARHQERDEHGRAQVVRKRQGAPQEGDARLRHDRSPRASG